MKKYHFFTCSKICTLALTGAGALFLASCAKDGFDDESFDGGVSNTQVAAVTADAISITASADGKSQTISWPVVMGAGGYRVNLIDISNPQEPIINDSIVDGCSVTAKREEDANYKLTILTLGNTKKNNTDASEVTTKEFSTFSKTYGIIPNGADIYTYFQENPLPQEPLGEELCFDLTPGGEYTLSNKVDFGGHRVTIRSTSKYEYARITMKEGSTFTTFAGFRFKYVDIDATELNHSILTLSDEPNDSIMDKIGTNGYYFIMDPITFQNSNIKSLGTNILSTNTAKYDIRNVLISNCVIEIDANSTKSSAFVDTKSGYITSFTAENSTIYAGDHTEKFFIQSGGRPKDITESETRSVSIINCTLANLTWSKNFCDYHNGQKTYYYTLLNTIVYDCGKPNFVTGLNKGQDSENPTWNVDNNTFWRAGADASAKQIGDDPSECKWITNNKGNNTVVTTDPEIDPATGDFTPAIAQQAAQQGDPRWYTK